MIWLCLLRILAEVIAGVLSNAVDSNKVPFIFAWSEAQVKTSVARHHLLVQILLLALVAEIGQTILVRCGIVRAWKDEPRYWDLLRKFWVEFLRDQISHPAVGSEYSILTTTNLGDDLPGWLETLRKARHVGRCIAGYWLVG